MRIEKVFFDLLSKQYLLMNKIIQLLGICLLFGFTQSCKNNFMLNQKQSKKSIIVRKSKATDEIAVIQFPFSLIIENKSLSKNEFGSIDYEYGYNDKGANIILIDNGEKISNYQLKVVPPKEKQTYLIYSVHFIDYSETTQN